jgi:hypothetical protein
MSETNEPGLGGSKSLRLVLIGGAVALVIIPVIALLLFIRSKHQQANGVAEADTSQAARGSVAGDDFAHTNSVTILLGAEEAGQGLRLVETQSDGLTAIEGVNGVSARVARFVNNRTTTYFYFQIHPSFKQQDVRGARIEVEYLDPQPGTMILQYDAQDSEDASNPVYREATRAARLMGSNVWQKASFRTKNDALFSNRQNGQSDFRISARTPVLYVRRVTVTLEANDELKWAGDFSTSNLVSILLGEEKPEDGLRHLANEGDGRTRIETIDGVVCRYLNRVADGKQFGYLYFTLNRSFKHDALARARVDVEYLTRHPGYFRLQFDGEEGGTRHKYTSVLPGGAQVVRFGSRAEYARIPSVGTWAVATFHVTNAVFRNGQNGDADFRLEAVPPEIYVRRITVTRDEGPPSTSVSSPFKNPHKSLNKTRG